MLGERKGREFVCRQRGTSISRETCVCKIGSARVLKLSCFCLFFSFLFYFCSFFFFRLEQAFALSFSMFEGCATCCTVELNFDEGVPSNYEQVTSVCLKILCYIFFFVSVTAWFYRESKDELWNLPEFFPRSFFTLRLVCRIVD